MLPEVVTLPTRSLERAALNLDADGQLIRIGNAADATPPDTGCQPGYLELFKV